MRWYILRTLVHKELLRNLGNRGGLVLALLLVVMALLLGLFGRARSQSTAQRVLGGVKMCYIDHWEEGPWIEHLKINVPDDLRDRVQFRPRQRLPIVNGKVAYEVGTGAIQVRGDGTNYSVVSWYYGDDASVLAPFEAWFWRESRRYFHDNVLDAAAGADPGSRAALQLPPIEAGDAWAWEESHRHFQQQVAAALSKNGSHARATVQVPNVRVERAKLTGRPGIEMSGVLAAALVLFALFFACVYLLPSLTCEERERGILLAQALSPASPGEILAAKFLFYPVVGIGLAAILAGLYEPSVLARPFFWAALVATAIGSMGVGLSIASLARTQRAASMGAMCYLMTVTMLLVICQTVGVPFLQYVFLEYHGPRMFEGIFANTVPWPHLVGTIVLATGWCALAMRLFRKRGWQ